VIHPTPPGTRDVLPDEMRELRAVSESLRASFDAAGYGEVSTPALEYEDVLRVGDERGGRSGLRLFDPEGRVLTLRSDTTIPIARVVATRYRDVEPPIRLSYFAQTYREVQPGHGQPREFPQAGIELIGAAAPQGTVEVVALIAEALETAGLRRHRIGMGDAALYRKLLDRYEVPREEHLPLLEELTRRNLVGIEMRVERLGLPASARKALTTLPTLRGGPEVLDRAGPDAAEAVEGLRLNLELLRERGVAGRVILDLGLLRELGYYTGAIFEVYDPAVGFALGGGGRYDELIGRYGRELPACGIALDLQRVHLALTAEERLANGGGG
jgi:ATP phosphoribosyltransferase regulatory subunit